MRQGPAGTGSACVAEETTVAAVCVTPDTALVTVAGGGSSTGGVTTGAETGAGLRLAIAGSGFAAAGAVGVVEIAAAARG